MMPEHASSKSDRRFLSSGRRSLVQVAPTGMFESQKLASPLVSYDGASNKASEASGEASAGLASLFAERMNVIKEQWKDRPPASLRRDVLAFTPGVVHRVLELERQRELFEARDTAADSDTSAKARSSADLEKDAVNEAEELAMEEKQHISEAVWPLVMEAHCSLMLADVSGFCKLTEEFCARGADGLDQLQSGINSCFSTLMDVINAYGGDVLNFAGDALIIAWFDMTPCGITVQGARRARQGNLDETVDVCPFVLDAYKRGLRPGEDLLEMLENRRKLNAIAATRCGLELVATQPRFHDRNLQLHVGVATGPLHLYVAGSEGTDFQFLAMGPLFKQIGNALTAAKARELVIDAATMTRATDFVHAWPTESAGLWGGGGGDGAGGSSTSGSGVDGHAQNANKAHELYYQVSGVELDAIERFLDACDKGVAACHHAMRGTGRVAPVAKPSAENVMRKALTFVPPPLEIDAWSQEPALSVEAEIREATVIFVKLDGPRIQCALDSESGVFLSLVDEIVGVAQQALRAFEGMLRQFLVDDKGMVMIFAFGVPKCVHFDDATRGLKCATKFCQDLARIDVSAFAGVTSGEAYSGTVGNPRRKEFALVGNTVNMAARLMSFGSKAARKWEEKQAASQKSKWRLAQEAVRRNSGASPDPELFSQPSITASFQRTMTRSVFEGKELACLEPAKTAIMERDDLVFSRGWCVICDEGTKARCDADASFEFAAFQGVPIKGMADRKSLFGVVPATLAQPAKVHGSSHCVGFDSETSAIKSILRTKDMQRKLGVYSSSSPQTPQRKSHGVVRTQAREAVAGGPHDSRDLLMTSSDEDTASFRGPSKIDSQDSALGQRRPARRRTISGGLVAVPDFDDLDAAPISARTSRSAKLSSATRKRYAIPRDHEAQETGGSQSSEEKEVEEETKEQDRESDNATSPTAAEEEKSPSENPDALTFGEQRHDESKFSSLGDSDGGDEGEDDDDGGKLTLHLSVPSMQRRPSVHAVQKRPSKQDLMEKRGGTIVLIRSEEGGGKSTFLQHTLAFAANLDFSPVTVCLRPEHHYQPYAALSAIFDTIVNCHTVCEKITGSFDPKEMTRILLKEWETSLSTAEARKSDVIKDGILFKTEWKHVGWDDNENSHGYSAVRSAMTKLFKGPTMRRIVNQDIIVAFDDIHFMDTCSWDIIMSLLASVDMNLLVVGTAIQPRRAKRAATTPKPAGSADASSEGGAPRPEVLQRKVAERDMYHAEFLNPKKIGSVYNLELSPLRLEDIEIIVRESFPDREWALSECERVFEASRGHPFLAIEIARGICADPSALDTSSDISPDADGKAGAVKGRDAITKAFVARLDGLSTAEQRCLKAASVIGPAFDYDTLAEILPRSYLRRREDEMTLLDAVLELLVLESFLRIGSADALRSDAVVYEFVHPKLQQTCYALLLRADQISLHKQVASWIARVNQDDLREYYVALLYHLVRADEHDKAMDYALGSIEAYIEAGAFTEACVLLSDIVGFVRKEKLKMRTMRVVCNNLKAFALNRARDMEEYLSDSQDGSSESRQFRPRFASSYVPSKHKFLFGDDISSSSTGHPESLEDVTSEGDSLTSPDGADFVSRMFSSKRPRQMALRIGGSNQTSGSTGAPSAEFYKKLMVCIELLEETLRAQKSVSQSNVFRGATSEKKIPLTTSGSSSSSKKLIPKGNDSSASTRVCIIQ